MSRAHLDPVRKQLRDTPMTPPPAPWRLVGRFAVGGLSCVGFPRDHEWIVVGSAAGVGIFDCVSGEKIARDDSVDGYANEYLEITGIGPIDRIPILTAGVGGGGLPLFTRDGWTMEVISLEWPENQVFLMEPGGDLFGSLHGRPERMHRIATSDTLRAAGFSYSGMTCVVAESSDLTLYSRVARS